MADNTTQEARDRFAVKPNLEDSLLMAQDAPKHRGIFAFGALLLRVP